MFVYIFKQYDWSKIPRVGCEDWMWGFSQRLTFLLLISARILLKRSSALLISLIPVSLCQIPNLKHRKLFGKDFPWQPNADRKQSSLLNSISLFPYLSRCALEVFKIYVNASTCFKQFEKDNLKDLNIIVIFYDVPKYVCLLLLTVKFIYVLVKTIKLRAEKKQKGMVCIDCIHEE